MAQSKLQPNGYTKYTFPKITQNTNLLHSYQKSTHVKKKKINLYSDQPDIIYTIFMSFRESFDVL